MPTPHRPPPSLRVKLSRAFQTLARELIYLSESDYPYRAFSADMPKTTPLTAESFRAAAGIGRGFDIEMRPAESFFERGRDPQLYDPEDVETYALLESIMRAALSDLQFISARHSDRGHSYAWRVRVYIVGRMEDGSLAGLSSISVET